MHRRLLAIALVLAVSATALLTTSCSDDDGKVHASATFPDVADMAVGAPVMMADITIGKVTGISLDKTGRRAKVRFEVDRSAEVPADVVARVRRTSALGEKFVDLTPRTAKAERAGAPLMRDGAVIRRTAVVSDLEQLVSSGTDTFEALSASQIAVLLDEGSKAFGGKGPKLREVLDDLATVADGYQGHTSEVQSIITDLDQLGRDLAPAVDTNGRALRNIGDSLEMLNANDERFFDLVRSLNRLADDGNRMLGNHLDEIRNQVRGLKVVAGVLADEQESVAGILRDLPRHNIDLPSAEKGNFVQVLLDVIICGVPGGGDVPGDPVDQCYPGGGK